MRDLLRNLEEAREIHVPIKELPDSLRAALKRVGYGARDIGVVAQDKVEPNPYAAEGQKGFVQVVDIASGRSRDLEGSWGGASPNSPSEIDFANRPVPIPEGGAVIIGVQGYPQTMATIYVHPQTIAAMLPPAAETTEREQTILRTIRSLNSAGRKEVFGREKVTPAEIDALVARGLLKKTKAGAVSITTAGKNVAEGQEDGMREALQRLDEGKRLSDEDVRDWFLSMTPGKAERSPTKPTFLVTRVDSGKSGIPVCKWTGPSEGKGMASDFIEVLRDAGVKVAVTKYEPFDFSSLRKGGKAEGMGAVLDRLEEDALVAELRVMDEAEMEALGDEIDEALTAAQRQAKADYKQQDWGKTQQRADTVVRSMAAINKYSTKRLMSMAKAGAGPGPGNQAMHKAIMLALRSRITKAKKSGGLKLRAR